MMSLAYELLEGRENPMKEHRISNRDSHFLLAAVCCKEFNAKTKDKARSLHSGDDLKNFQGLSNMGRPFKIGSHSIVGEVC